MLSDKCISNLGSFIKTANWCCFTRLSFDKSRNAFTYGNSSIKRLVSEAATLVLLSYSLFNFATLFYLGVIFPSGIDTVDLIWLILFSTGRFWGFYSQLTSHLYHKTISYFFNSLVYFNKKAKFDKSFGIGSSKDQDKSTFDLLNFIVLYFTGIAMIYPVGAVLMFTLRPKSSQFLYSMWIPEGGIVLPQFAFCLGFEWFIVNASLYALMVDGMTLFTIYILTIGSYLKNLHSNIKNKETSLNRGIATYKILILLGKIHKDSMGFLTPIFFTVFGIQWTLGAVGTIRLFHVVSPADYFILCILFFCGGIILLSIIHFSGNIPLRAKYFLKKTLRIWNYTGNSKSRQKRRYLIRAVRSLQIFGIRVEPVRLLKHNAIDLYFGAMINFIVTFLVAFPAMGKVKLVSL